jgi:hypothetical protein
MGYCPRCCLFPHCYSHQSAAAPSPSAPSRLGTLPRLNIAAVPPLDGSLPHHPSPHPCLVLAIRCRSTDLLPSRKTSASNSSPSPNSHFPVVSLLTPVPLGVGFPPITPVCVEGVLLTFGPDHSAGVKVLTHVVVAFA